MGTIRDRNSMDLTEAEDTTTFMAESKEEIKSLFMKVKRRERSWLKTQHSKTKIMASGPITSWKIDGETMETVTDFILLGSNITAGMKLKDAYSLEEKL